MDGPDPRESSEKPKYEYLSSNTKRDPYSVENAFYRAARAIGYPVEFSEGATDMRGRDISDHAVKVVTADPETSGKLGNLYQLSYARSTARLLDCVADGFPEQIALLMKGEEERSYRFKGVQVRKPLNRRILEESFMRAFERSQERAERLREQGHPFFPEEEELVGLYTELQEKGVRPLTPEAMQLLVAQDLKEIIEQHPDLAP